MIPRILHQTWKTARVPLRLRKYVRSWFYDQTWDYRFYDDAELRAVIRRSFPEYLTLYDNFDRNLERVDFARYALLYLEGGVYADLDFECLKSFDPLLSSQQPILGTEPDEHLHIYRFDSIICNALLMSPPRHDFWPRLMKFIADNYQHGGDVVYNTGPMALTMLKHQYPEAYDDVQIAPPSVFYPVIDSRFGGKRQGRFRHVSWNCDINDAYAAHHWVHTNDTLWHRFETTVKTTVAGMRSHFVESASGGYDARFYRGEIPADQRRIAESNALAHCAALLRANRIDAWLTGPSLLNWWNGEPLHSSGEMITLGVYYNDLYRMRLLAEAEDRYFLDVNPNHTARRWQARNLVDARFIDRDTGIFINLFGYHPGTDRRLLENKRGERAHVTDLFPLAACEVAGVEVARPANPPAVLRAHGNKVAHPRISEDKPGRAAA